MENEKEAEEEEVYQVPDSLLARYPQAAQIHEALTAYGKGRTITTRCIKCGQVLRVIEVPGITSFSMDCGNGCTRAHFQGSSRK